MNELVCVDFFLKDLRFSLGVSIKGIILFKGKMFGWSKFDLFEFLVFKFEGCIDLVIR